MGRASAIALAQAGWSVALLARRADMLEETKALCVDPAKVLLVEGDVAREEDVKRLFEATIDAFGERPRSFPPSSSVSSPAGTLWERGFFQVGTGKTETRTERIVFAPLPLPFPCPKRERSEYAAW